MWAARETTCLCGADGTVWTDVALPDSAYGVLLVRDSAGRHPALVPLIGDEAYEAVCADVPDRRGLLSRGPAASLVRQQTLLLLGDPSPDGLAYELFVEPTCPTCGRAATDVRPAPPGGGPVRDLPVLTHARYDAADPGMRARLRSTAVAQAREVLRRVGGGRRSRRTWRRR